MIIMFDTGALITLMDSTRPNHGVALQVLQEIIRRKEISLVSPLAISEYGVKADVQDIIKLNLFEIPPFTDAHGMEAATLKRKTMGSGNNLRTAANARNVIVNDTQIIAQAHVEGVDVILTEDRNTFYRTAEALRQQGDIALKAIPLSNTVVKELWP